MLHQFLFGVLEAPLVLLVQPQAVDNPALHYGSVLVPDLVIAALRDVCPTGRDHLVGHLDKEGRHSLRRVVVARVAVDHADGVDEAGMASSIVTGLHL